MKGDFELRLCMISNPRLGLTPGTALRLHGDCSIMNKGTVVTEYYFILLDTNMVPIIYY